MIKLTKHESPTGTPLIRIEGRLDFHCLDELHALVQTLEGSATIDLSGLVAADESGRTALHSLRHAGHRLSGGSLYIRQLLHEVRP